MGFIMYEFIKMLIGWNYIQLIALGIVLGIVLGIAIYREKTNDKFDWIDVIYTIAPGCFSLLMMYIN